MLKIILKNSALSQKRKYEKTTRIFTLKYYAKVKKKFTVIFSNLFFLIECKIIFKSNYIYNKCILSLRARWICINRKQNFEKKNRELVSCFKEKKAIVPWILHRHDLPHVELSWYDFWCFFELFNQELCWKSCFFMSSSVFFLLKVIHSCLECVS